MPEAIELRGLSTGVVLGSIKTTVCFVQTCELRFSRCSQLKFATMLVAMRGLALRHVRRSEVQKSPSPAFPFSRFYTNATSRPSSLFRGPNCRSRTSSLQDSGQTVRQPCRRYTSDSPNSRPSSFSDPSRPDLFYHLLGPPNPLSPNLPAFAVSFLDEPPPIPNSSTIIGWLPAASEGSGKQAASLGDFKENRKHVELVNYWVFDGSSQQNSVNSYTKPYGLLFMSAWMTFRQTRRCSSSMAGCTSMVPSPYSFFSARPALTDLSIGR
jgi:hypothetical protein